jgi:hypothetical protein
MLMTTFISGMETMGFLTGAMLFFRFWRKTGDSLFGVFGLAFCLFALNQVLIVFLVPAGEAHSLVFLPRLLGFVLLILAILAKNI